MGDTLIAFFPVIVVALLVVICVLAAQLARQHRISAFHCRTVEHIMVALYEGRSGAAVAEARRKEAIRLGYWRTKVDDDG